MVLSSDDCDECVPPYLRRSKATLLFSSLPFVLTFLFVATVVFKRLYPLLNGETTSKDGAIYPRTASSSRASPPTNRRTKRFSAITFSATIGLASVLVELVLCEVSDTINPIVRRTALRLTILLLLASLIIVIPSLELHSIISAAGYKYFGRDAGRLKIAWVLHTLGFGIWLFGFWWSGHYMLGNHHQQEKISNLETLVNASTEHVGVIGISLMALLSGFASASAPWQSFGARTKAVSEASVSRKQTGLAATNDMLAAKRSRLRALQRKMSDSTPDGFLKKAMTGFRGNADVMEKKSLEMEIAGLESMATSLSMSHSMLQSRLAQQQRSKSATGRLIMAASTLFSFYCLYRIFTTSLTAFRRRLAPSDQVFVGSDPINNILAILVKHYDSHLDREAWTRQISFLLSGIMLLASFSSVLQTFYFFARFAPGLLKAAQANLALIVAQVSGTYVISVALLLRGIMPSNSMSERLKGLGGSDMQWVDGWFEACFLGGVLVTAVGIWTARTVVQNDDWDDEDDVELGKKF